MSWILVPQSKVKSFYQIYYINTALPKIVITTFFVQQIVFSFAFKDVKNARIRWATKSL